MMCFYRPIARNLQMRHARAIFIGLLLYSCFSFSIAKDVIANCLVFVVECSVTLYLLN